jgi:hypothetical protein
MIGQASVVHVHKLVDDVVMWREAGHTKCLHHAQIFKDELPRQLQQRAVISLARWQLFTWSGYSSHVIQWSSPCSYTSIWLHPFNLYVH